MKSNRGAGLAGLSFQPMRNLSLAVIAFCAASTACRRDREPDPSASSTAIAARFDSMSLNPPASTSTPKSACPRTGQWALCSVEKRLKQSGFVLAPVKGQAPHRAGFSVVPALYTLGKSRLEVFLYPSPGAAARDATGLDTTSAAPRGQVNPWGMPPTFVRSANLIAIFLTDSPVQGERLTLALTAGAPQP